MGRRHATVTATYNDAITSAGVFVGGAVIIDYVAAGALGGCMPPTAPQLPLFTTSTRWRRRVHGWHCRRLHSHVHTAGCLGWRLVQFVCAGRHHIQRRHHLGRRLGEWPRHVASDVQDQIASAGVWSNGAAVLSLAFSPSGGLLTNSSASVAATYNAAIAANGLWANDGSSGGATHLTTTPLSSGRPLAPTNPQPLRQLVAPIKGPDFYF